MKKLTAILLLVLAGGANAATCKLPKNCTYLDSEFSTGGGDKVSYLMEVTCKMPGNRIVKYLNWELSVGSVFGMGRITAPNRIEFKPSRLTKLDCDY